MDIWSGEERGKILSLIVRANGVAEDLYAETATSKNRVTIDQYYKERDEFIAWLKDQEIR